MQKHLNYYIIEAFVLAVGFFAVYVLSVPLIVQGIMVAFLVAIYAVMGILHHRREHDIHIKIVLEYILISILVLSVFLFLKSGNA